MANGTSGERAAASAADRETRHILGGFISAGGVCVLIMSMDAVKRTWFVDVAPPFPIFGMIFPLLAAAAGLFWVVNPVGWPPPSAPVWTWLSHLLKTDAAAEQNAAVWKTCARVAVAGVVLAALIIGALEIGALLQASDRPPVFDQYILSLPPVEATAPQGAAGSSPNDGKPPPHAQPGATLIWAAQRNFPALPSGVLPASLGGVLIVLFGIVFPRLVVSTTKSVMTSAFKIVSPVASLALVGLGAAQQSVAADAAFNEHQVMAGKNPIPLGGTFLMSKSAYPFTQSSTVNLLDYNTASAEAIKLLSKQLQNLDLKIDGDHKQYNAELTSNLSQLSTRISGLALDMRSNDWARIDFGNIDLVKQSIAQIVSNMNSEMQT